MKDGTQKGAEVWKREEKEVKEIPNHFERMEMLNASRIQHLQHGFSSKWHQYASACNVQVHNSIQCANERYNGTFYLGLSKNWVWEIELLLPLLYVSLCVCVRMCLYVVCICPSIRLSLYILIVDTFVHTPHTQPQTKYNTAHSVDFSF